MLRGMPRPWQPEVADMYRYFGDELLGTLMPHVEANYRTRNDRSARAIAGFSRGGGQSLFTGLTHLDTFAHIASFSAYLTPQVWEKHFAELSESPAATNARIETFWLGVGEDDFLYNEAVTFNQLLTEKGIEHEELITPGGHTWMNARHYLSETLQRLFQRSSDG
jgi:enterochelin esterase family protein